ncbi:hypothetical protein HJC23_004937 [Cyclotella cryptica]|uniref:Uncharacterized protein n=1 Tax=Cyclotella cryptica TaxID=29204 RepID=A0ABD3PSG3_9STRA|eukprot:CCRYP_011885-RA/>CCRYP_011885-RA protein AED:0.44 eAED:0.44 QI:0/-1/0/1/-1/1/1/0/193
MASPPNTNIPDAKSMDGPKVNWTVADTFRPNPHTAMTYHVMSAGYSAFTPLGAAIGALLYGAGWRRFPSVWATMGSTGLVAGGLGLLAGLGGMQSTAKKGEKAKIPWTEEGIQQRVDGLSHNFKVRVIDLSVWSGIGLAAGVLMVAGPGKLKLSPGVLGALQGVSLGSALGSLGAIGCIFSTATKEESHEDED